MRRLPKSTDRSRKSRPSFLPTKEMRSKPTKSETKSSRSGKKNRSFSPMVLWSRTGLNALRT